MNTQLLTRCPHCQTLFKLQPQQIEAAGGFVRCGSCMQVFKAHKNMIDTPAPASDSSVSRNVTDDKTHWSQALTNDIDKIYDYLAAELDTTTPDQSSKSNAWAKDLLAELEEDIEPHENIPSIQTDFVNADQDQDFETKEKRKTKSTPLPRFEENLTDSFRKLPSSAQKSPGFNVELTPAEKDNDDETVDEAWAEKMLKELEHHTPKPSLPLQDKDHTASLNDTWSQNILKELDAHAKNIAQDIQTAIQYQEHKQQKQITPLLTPSEDHKKTTPAPKIVIHTLEDPLGPEMNQKPSRTVPWLAGSLLAILLLLIQYAVFNFQTLAQKSALRPWYGVACEFFKCELPVRKAIDNIKSANLAVRSHPTAQNALMIDAIIENKASFAQPFPDLELRFTDLNGRILARRRFTPEEYRKSDSLTLMPPQHPIHLSLEILDPGKNAVNYQLNILEHPDTPI